MSYHIPPRVRALFAALALPFSALASKAQDVVISEFMASNSATAVSGQISGEFHDWIEVHNRGTGSVNLVGWHLSDDDGVPFKWTFPSLTIPAGGYRVVFASGLNTPANGVNHTNFALDSRGGYVALARPDLSIASSHDYPKQFANVSYGIPAQGGGAIHLASDTPGAANGNTEYLFVRDTSFSHKRGHYSSPFDVSITTATPSATIRYTTDGTEPQQSGNGTTYTGPVTISTTTVLRARAFLAGHAPTNTDTQTYIFPTAVATQTAPPGYPTNWQDDANANYDVDPDVSLSAQYSERFLQALSDLPTLCVATDADDIFGSGGIYTNSRNDSLETAVSAEYFHPAPGSDGTNIEDGFQLDCGFKVQGGASRNPSSSNKHSLSLRFRSQYGESKLNYRLFEESAVDEFDSIHLRAMYNNSWIHRDGNQRNRATMIRDQWIRDSLIEMGQADGGHGHFVHLFINGLYWGVYNLHERLDNDHYAAYNGGRPDTIDSLNPGDSFPSSFSQMRSIVSGGTWEQIIEVLDVDSYIDFYLIQHFGHNDDLKTDGNWRAAGGGSSQAPWRFYAWDSERVLENVSNTGSLGKSQDGASLISHLDDHEEFRVRFADRVQKHLFDGGALTSERNLARWTRYSDMLDRAIVAESARWGDDRRSAPYTRDNEWLTEVNKIKNTFFRSATPNRTSYMITKFQNESWGGHRKLLDATAPTFEVNSSPQHGGQIEPADQVGFANVGGTVFYTTDGSDPRVPTSGSPPIILFDAGADCTAFVPADDSLGLSWTGREFDDSDWIQGTTGVGFDSPAGGYNGLFNLDLSAMKGQTASGYIRIPFEIPDQASLDAVGTMTLNMMYDDGFIAWINGTRVADDNAPATPTWNSSTSGVNRNEGLAVEFTPHDASAGVAGLVVGTNVLAIQILNSGTGSSDLLCVPQLTYTSNASTAKAFSSDFQLPATTTLKARTLDGSDWSALVEATFIVEPPARPGDLIITELNYHPADPTLAELEAGQALTPARVFDSGDFEFIELQNIAGNAINLDGVHFTEGIDYNFGAVILLPGERLVLARDLSGFNARYGAAGGVQVVGPYLAALDNNGETLSLAANDESIIQSFEYDDGGGWPGRPDGAASTLELVTSAGDPSLASSWRPSSEFNGSPGFAGSGPDNRIIINEVLAHTDLPEVDSIELYNTTGSPIDISGWYLSDTRDDYTRFQIPDGTVIPAGGFIVFDETDFNNSGTPSDFALSGSRGDDVYLLEANAAGLPTRFVDHIEFGGSFNGVTLGRWPDGSGRVVPLGANTLGASNAPPIIGSVIISEIMYHPPGFPPGHEFIELLNTGAESENLDHWTLRGGVDFDFGATHSIPAGGTLVLVNFDPSDNPSATAFRNAYGIDASVPLAGPWTDGNLDNGGDLVRIQRPDTPPLDEPDYHPQVIEDISDFDDQAPWPVAADGAGSSLNRILPAGYGSDAASWTAASPSPGTPPLSDDPDLDGLSALIEYALNLDPESPDADQLPMPLVEGDQLTYSYPRDTSKTDISYQVEASSDLKTWTPVSDTLVGQSGNIETRKASLPLTEGRRYLRLKISRP